MDINIQEFKKQVLKSGAKDLLPGNLSDEWLSYLSQILGNLDDEPDEDIFTIILTIVTKILTSQKKFKNKLSFSLEELFNYCEMYRLEVETEIISRHSDIHVKPATLQTIFTNRKVEFQMKSDQTSPKHDK